MCHDLLPGLFVVAVGVGVFVAVSVGVHCSENGGSIHGGVSVGFL